MQEGTKNVERGIKTPNENACSSALKVHARACTLLALLHACACGVLRFVSTLLRLKNTQMHSVHLHVDMQVHACTSVYIRISICMFICMYVYMYLHHLYIYTYKYRFGSQLD